jgi:hypothetical protein
LTNSRHKKADFLRYAVQLNCINPVRDITKCPLPPLEEIAQGIHIQLQDIIKKGTLSWKDLDTAINLAEAEAEWFLENPYDCAQLLNLNKHLGAEGAMSPGRVQDPKGAKMITISFNTAA